MPTKECIEIRKKNICLSECMLLSGKHQKYCCDCDYREKPMCDIIQGNIPGLTQCNDCSFPRV